MAMMSNGCRWLLLAVLLFSGTSSLSGPGLVASNSKMVSSPQTHWLERLVINLFNYLVILLPGGLLVLMVKNKLCFPRVRSCWFVKLFVYGKENHGPDDVEMQKMLLQDEDEKSTPLSTPLNKGIRLLYCFFGLQISYLFWGLLQEKIMTTEYVISPSLGAVSSHQINGGQMKGSHEGSIKFRDSQFLVLVNRILALVFAVIGIVILGGSKRGASGEKSKVAPLYAFVFCSLSNVMSSWCQYEALKFVDFPTQVLSKACKILPVMLMSQVVGGKRYQTYEYVGAITISLGMSMFLWGNHLSTGAKQSESSYSSFDGLLVLGLYLTFDSFTSNWQGKLFETYKISSCQMMAAVNFYSIILTFWSLAQQGDLVPVFRTVLSSSHLSLDCILLSLFSAAGQMFVYYTISTFGAHVFVIIMTLRQAFAIILSCIMYGHTLTLTALVGVFVVFATLFTQVYLKQRNKAKV